MKCFNVQRVFKVLEPIIDTLLFLSIKYILLCCGYAFRMDPHGSLVFNSIELFVYCRYYFILRKSIFGERQNRIAVELLFSFVIWIISSLLIYIFVMLFGYLEVSTILKEVKL